MRETLHHMIEEETDLSKEKLLDDQCFHGKNFWNGKLKQNFFRNLIKVKLKNPVNLLK